MKDSVSLPAGGNEFQTGSNVHDVSMTTESRLLSRNFPKYFRRQGAETDLTLRVVDTPPLTADPLGLQESCPEGVHVLVIVARADRPCGAHVQKLAQVRRDRVPVVLWRRFLS